MARARWPIVSVAAKGLIVALAAGAGYVAPSDPNRQELRSRLKPPLARGANGHVFLFGTDHLGRDLFSRVVYGARVSLTVSSVSVLLAGAIGFLVGLVTGYFGGVADAAVMRVVDLQLAFPFILLAMAIVALLGPSLINIIAVFVLTAWPTYARVVRASVQTVSRLDFVTTAIAVGNPTWRVIARHVAPNVLTAVVVIASFEVSRMIILESALAFLGLGVPPPTPTWGGLLADGRGYIRDAWWLTVLPGSAILATTAAINFIADFVRNVLDPTFQGE
jgi:peptide/nickel transport system permease protein